ncbi:LysM peptidoglycan-binding domain-containing protein [Paenibacillus sp. FSL K6-1096]|uniref:LysM peptidoglycan-binding domain-containing protein n=1 Tax=Paenibacillus sp. FSL K6-1096 TaxID=2921460 RepID=UPI0030ED35C8
MKIHIVKQGDTLFALSQKYGVPLSKIIEANPQIANPDVLAVGDKVKIPAAPVPVPDNNDIYYKHTVKQGDTLWKLSKAWGITLKDMIDANPQLKNPNALMTGEVVNIPKKVSTAPIQAQSTPPAKDNTASILPQSTAPVKDNNVPVKPQSTAPAVVDKTAIGGKTYTGVIEKPAPVSPAAEAVPVPISAPAPNPAPNPPPKAPEVMPVQEIVHEKQSLYVQISVPPQEAPVYEKTKEAHKTNIQPAAWNDGKGSSCGKGDGYPGLNENPYFMNYAPVYPMYEPMAVMDNNNAPGYVQPAAFMPDCPPYPANQYLGAWYPNVAPDYNNVNMSAVSPANDNMSFAPQYQGEQVSLPWPNCGCGGMAVQPYPYEQPMYNPYPMYAMPQTGMVSPYAGGMNSMPNMASPMYEQPMVSNIPPYPAYPGMENFAHNRVPEIQVPELAPEETAADSPVQASAEAVPAKEAKASKGGASKSGAAKAKTSGHTTASKNKTASKPRTSQSTGERTSTSKKNSSPWAPN